MVVWFLAAMSLLVSGMVSQARVDARLAQIHVARAKVVAASDGAINLFLAQYTAVEKQSRNVRGPLVGNYQMGNLEVKVEMIAAAGLIDLRSANRKTLTALFSLADVGGEEAQTMANSVIMLRPSRGGARLARESQKGRRKPLQAIEDLLRAEGVNRTELDAVRNLVTVGGGSRNGVNWTDAPDNVRAVVAIADPRLAASAANEEGAADEEQKSSGSRSGSSSQFRVDATMRYGDRTWLRRRWITLRGGEGQLPWRVYRTEAPRVMGAG